MSKRDDLVVCLIPGGWRQTGDFNPRRNVKTVVRTEFGKRNAE
jgi:hypothetical protein